MFNLYADVLLGLPLKQSYTYQVPEEYKSTLKCGMRVEVEFRSRKEYGVVERLHHNPKDIDLLPLEKQIDPEPLVTHEQIKLAYWIGEQHLCSPGEALWKMFPKGKRFPKSQEVPSQETPSQEVPSIEVNIESKLTHEQRIIYEKIRKGLRPKEVRQKEKGAAAADFKTGQVQSHLLHGITGSGKTEIYIYLIRDVLQRGQTALLLVPEISLTVQLIERLRRVFGRQLSLLHSGLKNTERFSSYLHVLRGHKKIAVGTRSAVFAPLNNLGIIILDEEHDSSFKENSTPRCDARQIALKRAKTHQALVLCGSATPRIEAVYHTSNASNTSNASSTSSASSSSQSSPALFLFYHSLKKRAKGKGLPQVQLVRIPSPDTIISSSLLFELEQNLKKKEQSLLLLNRRGYFPHVYCVESKTVETCPACAVSLNLHRNAQLRCHYCGYQRPYDGSGSDGGAASLLGTGTQKLEDFLLHHFPSARIERLDTDSVSRRNILEDTLLRFLNREIDILIGTQMIARGLDAPYLSLVGVIQAESGLYLPDFRAAEKTFSLLTQVAGRAGRSEITGRVIFECLNPQEPIIQAAANQDYEAFYHMELPIRKAAFYPPFSRVVRLLCRGKDQERIHSSLENLVKALKERLYFLLAGPDKIQILGPVPAPIEKMHHKYREHAIIKTTALPEVRRQIKEILSDKKNFHLHHEGDYLEIDFDPADIL